VEFYCRALSRTGVLNPKLVAILLKIPDNRTPVLDSRTPHATIEIR
jgi:hypothetical protein